MTRMRRLREETRCELARTLLESVDADRPESGAEGRALGALGLGAVVVASSAKGAALAGGVASGAGASSVAPTAAGGGALLLVKWIGIGVIGGAVAIGSVEYARLGPTAGPMGGDDRAAHRAAAPSLPAPTLPAFATAPVPLSADASVAPPTAPRGASARPVAGDGASALRAARSTPEAARSPAGATTEQRLAAPDAVPRGTSVDASAAEPLTVQLDALNAVRGALRAGEPGRALTLLAELVARNPSSPLMEEITVLRIDALIDAGRDAEAATLADAFARAHPQSAYGQHVRSRLKSP